MNMKTIGKRKKLQLVLKCTLLVFILFVGFISFQFITEPSHQSTKRSDWATLLYKKGDKSAIEAFRSMGKKGVPWLVKQGLKSNRLTQKARNKLPGRLKGFIPLEIHPQLKLNNIAYAFIELKEDFSPFVHLLKSWLESNQDLAILNGLRVLKYFPDEAQSLQSEILFLYNSRDDLFNQTLILLKAFKTDPDLLIPGIQKRFQSPIYSTRVQAVKEALKLNLETAELLPILESILNKGTFNDGFQAMAIIGSLGPEASSLRPAITNFVATIPDYLTVPPNLISNTIHSISTELPQK